MKKRNRFTVLFIAASFFPAFFLAQCSPPSTPLITADKPGESSSGVIENIDYNATMETTLGAEVGGQAGVVIGQYMDREAESLKKNLRGATVERTGESIHITFTSVLAFDRDSFTLKPADKEILTGLAKTLDGYEHTNILIEGHTDSTGTEEYNIRLSKRRAESVAHYLEELAVDSARVIIVGYGENQPVSTVDSQNKRVEIAIFANAKLKRMAENGKLKALLNL